MAKKQGQPFDRRTFLKTTGAVGTAAALANVASAHGDHDEDEIRHGEDRSGQGPGANQLVVGVSAAASPGDVESDLPAEASVVRRNDDLNYLLVEMPGNQGEFGSLQVESRIARHQHVRYTEKNETFYPMEVTPDEGSELALPSGEEVNDRLFSEQYAPQQVRAPKAWNKTMGSDDVTVAIVDQGVKYDHPDLKDRFGEVKGKDFVDDDDDPMPKSMEYEYHGTHVAGIASATTGNGTGVAGMSNSRLLSCRALGMRGGSIADISDAIKWAADEGADFINMSLGGGGFSQTMKNAVSYALDKGTLSICAAGNSCKEGVSYPAKYNECMAISAINEDLELASFSQYGENVDVTGPGVKVLSCWTKKPKENPYDGKYNKISGTSMSTPAVTGVAALVKAAFPDFTPGQVRQRLKQTAVDIGLSEKEQGAGRVDAVRAVGWEGESGENTGPSLEMELEPSTPHVGQDIIMRGVNSSDDDGYIAKWEWSFDDGTTAVGEQTFHQFTEPGEHEVSLTVTDDDGATKSTTETLEVKRGVCGDETHTETFDGQLGRGRDINRHPYDFETEEPCRIRAVMDGSFLLFAQQQSTDWLKTECEGDLVITDDDLRDLDTDAEISIGAYSGFFGGSGEYQIQVEEEGFGQPKNEQPVARFTASATTVKPEEIIEFDASGSKDPDGSIQQYVWTFGDVAATSGETAVHSFDNPGEYAVTLEVTDDGGAKHSASKIITVEDPDALPDCSGEGTKTMEKSGSLGESPGKKTYTHSVQNGQACRAKVELSGPDSADFDLYVTLDGREPTTTDYDRRSWNEGSEESVEIGADELDGQLGILVDSYSGTGEFDLTVTEIVPGSGGSEEAPDEGQDDGGDESGSENGDENSGDEGSASTCGAVRKTDTLRGRIGISGERHLRYRTQTENPCQVTLSLSGPYDADFDLYASLDGSRAQSYANDLKSETPSSNEQIVIEDVSADGEIGILVQSWGGDGSFTISVEELGK